jgi:superfamily II DNA or RNA helicase
MKQVVLPELYPHQTDHKDRVRAALKARRSVVLQAEPGVGKTRMTKWILGSYHNTDPRPNQSGNALFVVYGRGLVDNARNSFREEPELPHAVLMSGRDCNPAFKIQVASIDTLLSWFCEGGEYSWDMTFDLIVFDEAHAHHSKFHRFLNAHLEKRESTGLVPPFVIGLTATPESKGMADVYREIVTGKNPEWLIANGFLKSYRYFHATDGQLGKLVRRGKEFTKDSVSAAMEGMSGDLVRDWKRLAEGRATIGFFPRRSHAKEAQALLEQNGVRAKYVDGQTKDDMRAWLYEALNTGEIDYLCNVGVCERGTDIPRVSCVQMCTSVGTRKRWRQMIARASRRHPDIMDAIVIDHGGNLSSDRGLGFFEDEVDWSLDITTKPAGEEGARPTIECPQCTAVYRGGRCKSCGYEPTPKERGSQGLEFNGTELTEIKRRDSKARKKKTCAEIMVSALYRAGKSGRTWKQAVGMAYGMAEKQGTKMRIPKEVQVGGTTIRMLPYGHHEAGRKVRHLFDGRFS